MRKCLTVVLTTSMLLLTACSLLTSQKPEDSTAIESEAVTRQREDGTVTEEITKEEPSQEYPGQWHAGETTEPETEPEEEMELEIAENPRLLIATDIHYLAEDLAGEDSVSFDKMAYWVDGRAVHYVWEITDAFIEEVINQDPDVLILCGDLSMDGERESHQELAKKLSVIKEAGIQVLVIPGNHDINNHDAVGYDQGITYQVDPTTPEEFAQIYKEYGFEHALSRDESSLSYTYALNDNYWIMMLDSCQYTPKNLVGGMIQDGTYEWIEDVLEKAWDEGVQIIPVTHHNLLDQSGVSKAFYDNCTIEHDEKLINLLEDYGVILHLSGHLHVQHYRQSDEGYGIYEVVTSSLTMAPFQYGILEIMDTGNMVYHTEQVDVSYWAKQHGRKDSNLSDFEAYGKDFLRKVTYQHSYDQLRRYINNKEYEDLNMTKKKAEQMSEFYAKMCQYYYAGRVYLINEEIVRDPAYEMWSQMGHITELSDFLNNILEDAAEDYNKVEVEY